MHPTGVVHGRFQPFHNDHLAYVLRAAARAQFLYVGISNPDPEATAYDATDPARSEPTANPWTYYQRLAMITGSLLEAGVPQERFTIVPFPINRPERLQFYTPPDAIYFLSVFDEWGSRKQEILAGLGLRVEILAAGDQQDKGLTATEVRTRMRLGQEWQHLVPAATARYIYQHGLPTSLLPDP